MEDRNINYDVVCYEGVLKPEPLKGRPYCKEVNVYFAFSTEGIVTDTQEDGDTLVNCTLRMGNEDGKYEYKGDLVYMYRDDVEDTVYTAVLECDGTARDGSVLDKNGFVVKIDYDLKDLHGNVTGHVAEDVSEFSLSFGFPSEGLHADHVVVNEGVDLEAFSEYTMRVEAEMWKIIDSSEDSRVFVEFLEGLKLRIKSSSNTK